MQSRFLPAAAAAAAMAVLINPTSVHAALATFGSGANTFDIEFVAIGSAGNAADSTGYGAVSYAYNLSILSVSENMLALAAANGASNLGGGAWSGNQPAANVNWYQAASFVNWLNTSSGHQAAYNLNGTATAVSLWSSGDSWQLGGENRFRHKDAYYFLPSEDEWYKAAYFDGSNYSLYAFGTNTGPSAVVGGTITSTAVYTNAANFVFPSAPATVDQSGGLSPYGTRGQTGNVNQWMESAVDGTNDDASEARAIRGGSYRSGLLHGGVENLRSDARFVGTDLANFDNNVGFRVGSVTPVPEPTTLGAGLLCLGIGLARRRRLA